MPGLALYNCLNYFQASLIILYTANFRHSDLQISRKTHNLLYYREDYFFVRTFSMLTFKIFKNESRLKDWLDTTELRLEKLVAAYNAASFNKYVGRPAPDLNGLDAEISDLLTNPNNQANIEGWAERVSEPLLRRRLELLERTMREAEVCKNPQIYELRNILNERLINFQPVVEGEALSRSDILYLLRNDDNRERRQQVYEQALAPLSLELDDRLRRLVQLRNTEALRLGYPNYAALHLNLQGLSRDKLFGLFDRLENLTEVPYNTFLQNAKSRYGWERLEAWDIAWLTEQQASLPVAPFTREKIVPLAYNLLSVLGLKPENLPIEIVNKDIPFGGLCFTIRVPDDIRIVSSPKDGYPYFRTMAHEFGHALHAAYNQQKSYLLKREWGIFNEGMAEVLAYFTHYPEWLAGVTGLSSNALAEYKEEAIIRRIFRLRTLVALARFEIEVYEQPQADFNLLLAQNEQRYLKIPLDMTPRWAASSFPTTHPLYRHNYILADLIAAQTHATLRREFGSLFELKPTQKTALFSFLCEHYYAPGAALEWPDKVRRATGKNLSTEDLLTECGLEA